MIAAVAAVGGYLALCGAARVLYPRLLFPAPRIDGTPAIPNDPDAKLVTMGSTVGIHWAAPEGARTVVFFHGNGETIFHNLELAHELHARKLGVLLVEYRGYGTLHGPPPSEAMLYEDGEAALKWLAEQPDMRSADGALRDDRVAIYGWSLGSGVAAEMASRGHGARLVLVSPFTSITEMGRRFAPFLPVSMLMSHKLDTVGKGPGITQPTLVVHGDADELIPFAMGERVAGVIPRASLVRVTRGHHADMFWPGSGTSPNSAELWDRVAAFVAQ